MHKRCPSLGAGVEGRSRREQGRLQWIGGFEEQLLPTPPPLSQLLQKNIMIQGSRFTEFSRKIVTLDVYVTDTFLIALEFFSKFILKCQVNETSIPAKSSF